MNASAGVVDPEGAYTCGTTLESLSEAYSRIHGWLSIFVSLFGTLANALNIVVLTRREMRSPTNAVLTGLAVADVLVLIVYIPYVVHRNLYHRSRRETYKYGWAVFLFLAARTRSISSRPCSILFCPRHLFV